MQEPITQSDSIDVQMESIHGESSLSSFVESTETQSTSEPSTVDFKTSAKSVKHSVKIHKCMDCSYTTDRKHTLRTHQAESCAERRIKGLLAVKDKRCKFCSKQMSHNGLRSHLRHFINSLTKNGQPEGLTKGKHAKISLVQFNNYLNEIKLTK